MKKERVKKPFYKKWWFYLIIVLLVIGKLSPQKEKPKEEVKAEKVYTQEEIKNNVTEEKDRVNVIMFQANERLNKTWETAINYVDVNLYDADLKIEEAQRIIRAEDENLKDYKPSPTGDETFDSNVKWLKKEMIKVNESRLVALSSLRSFVNDPKPAKLTTARQFIQESSYKANKLKENLEKL